jgi:aspartate/methionine/tyrosine aminotransferase
LRGAQRQIPPNQSDLDALAASLSSKTKLVSLASPQNPSGVRTSRAIIEQILVLLESRAPQAVLFIDETYREATYGNEAAPESCRAAPAHRHGCLGVESAGRTWLAHRMAHGV